MSYLKAVSRLVCPLIAATVAVVLSSCSSSKGGDDAPATVYGTMVLANSKAGTDNASFSLTAVDACSRNIDSGLVNVTLSQGANKPSLSIAIKNYTSAPQTFTCKQQTDNKASATDVGSKFDSCMVDVKVLSAAAASTLNGYSMYRDTIATKPFDYTGTCTIQVTAATPSIVGKISCTSMFQTILDGSAPNPFNAAMTADVSADINCAFR